MSSCNHDYHRPHLPHSNVSCPLLWPLPSFFLLLVLLKQVLCFALKMYSTYLTSLLNIAPSHNWLRFHHFISSLQVVLPAYHILHVPPLFKVSFNLMHLHVASGFFFYSNLAVFDEPSTLQLFPNGFPYTFSSLECYSTFNTLNSPILFFPITLQIYILLLSLGHLICPFFSSLLITSLMHARQENNINTLKLSQCVYLSAPFILFTVCSVGPTPRVGYFCTVTQSSKDAKIYLLNWHSFLSLSVAHCQYSNSYS